MRFKSPIAAAAAPIGPLAWDPPYAAGVTLKRQKNIQIEEEFELWCRPAATALIRPQAWQPPYAVGVALKRP